MAFNFNGKTPKKILFKGLNVAKVIYNGVIVWLQIILKTIAGIPPLKLLDVFYSDEEEKYTKLADYKIYGNSVQDGTPTPEAPIDIESVGDKTKNLLNQEDLQKKNSWVALENASNRWGYKLPIEEVGEYTLSFKSLGTYYNETYLLYVYIMRYDTGSIIDGRKIITQIYSNTAGNATPNDVKINFTVEEGYDYYIWTNASGYSIYPLYDNTNFTNWQLEKGNVATEYEPYGYKVPVKVRSKNLLNQDTEPQTYNVYLKEPLRKIGDYADYIDFEKGKVIRKVKETTLTGDEYWAIVGSTNNTYFYRTKLAGTGINLVMPPDTTHEGQFCNYLPSAEITTSNTVIGASVYYSESQGFTFFRCRLPQGVVTDTFEQYLKDLYSSGKPMKYYYATTQKVEETITLPNIPTHKGTTIIEIDTTIQPSNMEVQYYGKGV